MTSVAAPLMEADTPPRGGFERGAEYERTAGKGAQMCPIVPSRTFVGIAR